ncbi:MarR family transcriptional regulator [Paenibacillus alkaliterrae]|uniref:MarR family winged helix-turn-helix transcriptional regulator n=1 Tax=Paenibacillus alkaliterrae TaxID=320909 RepID=UPI001F39BD57|nr:MarR family transcriptional regulator [Paenibacillus alkaliterrae]MCF2940060.1 MarR family transcriptional regulator [Paenibacillus alkaliterrae]
MKQSTNCPTRFPWELEDSNTVLIKLVFMAIRRKIEAALRPLGLTPQQSQSLHFLALNPGVTNADLEKQLFIDKSSVTSLINGMVKRGWVVRREHAQDARVKQIFLTDNGQELFEISSEAVKKAKDLANERLTEEESRNLQMLLRKILKSYE